MNKRRRLRCGLAAAVFSALALSGCEEQVRARHVFGDELLATEDVAGLRVVDERWLDGGDGGLMGKPSYATVSLTFSTEDGVSQEMAVATLVSRAEETGWTRVGDQSSENTYVARKDFERGDGRLLVSTTGVGPDEVMLRMSLQ
jgi:hypothetical protein